MKYQVGEMVGLYNCGGARTTDRMLMPAGLG